PACPKWFRMPGRVRQPSSPATNGRTIIECWIIGGTAAGMERIAPQIQQSVHRPVRVVLRHRVEDGSAARYSRSEQFGIGDRAMSYGRNPQRSPEEVNASGKDWFTLYTVFKRAGSSIKRVRPSDSIKMSGGNRMAKAVTDFFTDQDAVTRD